MEKMKEAYEKFLHGLTLQKTKEAAVQFRMYIDQIHAFVDPNTDAALQDGEIQQYVPPITAPPGQTRPLEDINWLVTARGERLCT